MAWSLESQSADPRATTTLITSRLSSPSTRPSAREYRWLHSGIASHLLSGWSLNGIFSAQSGPPIYVIQGTGNNLNAAGSAQVPDLVKSNVAIYGGIGVGHPYFDTAAFAQVNVPANLPQRFGTSGRNNIRGPAFLNMDTGLFRTFTIRERFNLQFRAEALNILNHPNFANPNADVSSGVNCTASLPQPPPTRIRGNSDSQRACSSNGTGLCRVPGAVV